MTSSSEKMSTRHSTKHSVFGFSRPLGVSQLPTKDDVFKCYLWYRNSADFVKAQSSTREILKHVADDVVAIWNKAGIPVIKYESVVLSLQKLISKGQDLQKFLEEKKSC